MNLQKRVFSFFEQHIDSTHVILLALSGGPDSICLLNLARAYGLTIHIVHVDHGWRKESQTECQTLSQLASTLGVPFHTTTLHPEQYTGNLEEESRNDRLQFFEKIVLETGSQGVLLGHHAGDQAETVFKRMLEGVVRGISPVTQYGLMTLFRPLLDSSKPEILDYLHAKNIGYFNDPTNEDGRYLRARMRNDIFPALRASFGKAFEENLCEIARGAESLNKYLDAKIKPFLDRCVKSELGTFFEQVPAYDVELHYFIKNISKSDALSRDQVHALMQLLSSKKADKRIIGSHFNYVADRGSLFVLRKDVPVVAEAAPLHFGVQEFGPWIVTVSKICESRKNHWKDLFAGHCRTVLAEGDYVISSVKGAKYRQFLGSEAKNATKILNKYFNTRKVPHFLLKWAPMILKDDHVVEDFVTDTPTSECGATFGVTLTMKTF